MRTKSKLIGRQKRGWRGRGGGGRIVGRRRRRREGGEQVVNMVHLQTCGDISMRIAARP